MGLFDSKEKKLEKLYVEIGVALGKKDYVEAAKLLQKAVNLGDANAQFTLGTFYANGQGVTKDPKKAFELLSKASEQDHNSAQLQLGFYYSEGIGVSKDEKKAMDWFRKSAENGNEQAIKMLKQAGL